MSESNQVCIELMNGGVQKISLIGIMILNDQDLGFLTDCIYLCNLDTTAVITINMSRFSSPLQRQLYKNVGRKNCKRWEGEKQKGKCT